MASSARTLNRLVRSAPTVSRPASRFVPRSNIRQSFRRSYADNAKTVEKQQTLKSAAGGKSNAGVYAIVALIAAGAGGYYLYSSPDAQAAAKTAVKGANFKPEFKDYQQVYDDIAAHLIEHDNYDDGSYGPVLVRLGWHASGTYDKDTKTGGSNGATMRFAPEGDHGANAGLKAARDFLEPIKGMFDFF